MLVNFSQTLTLAATQQDAWNLLRDTKRLSALIPSVESVTPVDADGAGERYLAKVVERVGPFRLRLNLEVRSVQAVQPPLLQAEVSGVDLLGQTRLSGTLSVELKKASSAETLLTMDSRLEVTGKLATLGAAPIRRRANELFARFAERLLDE